jgi:serine/threonine protein kinase
MTKDNKHNKKLKYKIIGEGGYGCVHMPALPCQTRVESRAKDRAKDRDNNDDNYVSKLMTKKNALKELNEFVFIGKLDKQDEYHLGEPKMCNPDTSSLEVMKNIGNCKHISLSKVMLNPSDYKLLILKYGGVDLDNICGKELFKYFSKSSPKAIDRFWLEVHQLLRGLVFFQRNNIVHYDLKPQNILYNPKTGKMRFIDFGLMRSTSKIIRESSESDNGLGVVHWSSLPH